MLPEMGERDRASVGVRGGGACGKRVVAKTVDGSAPGGTSIFCLHQPGMGEKIGNVKDGAGSGSGY
jgi:hypothetical protein